MNKFQSLKSWAGALCLAAMALCLAACADNKTEQLLRNDCLKRTLGPNVAGTDIYFVYAMAQPYGSGKIIEAQVEATIPGAQGTMLEHRSFHTDNAGTNVPVQVAEPCVNEGSVTRVVFNTDTCAASLRYYYVVPDEARGKEVSFTFSAKNSLGERVSYKMGPYKISKCEIKRDIELKKSRCYISIEDMEAYTLEEAEQRPDKIDLVYLWRNKTDEGVEFGHVFAAPVADREWLDDVIIPASFTRNILLRKEHGVIDAHLTSAPNNGTYIDDIDFETIKLEGMPNYCVNMKEEGGMWVETHDGMYRAYIYINSLKKTSGGTISIKRYKVK